MLLQAPSPFFTTLHHPFPPACLSPSLPRPSSRGSPRHALAASRWPRRLGWALRYFAQPLACRPVGRRPHSALAQCSPSSLRVSASSRGSPVARPIWFLGRLVRLGTAPSRHAFPSRRAHLRSHSARPASPLGSVSCASCLSRLFHARAPLLFSKSSLTASNLRL